MFTPVQGHGIRKYFFYQRESWFDLSYAGIDGANV
jgi:hypothetical protein